MYLKLNAAGRGLIVKCAHVCVSLLSDVVINCTVLIFHVCIIFIIYNKSVFRINLSLVVVI